MKIRNGYAVPTIIVAILLAGCATETRVSPLQPIELGNLTFLAPPGEDWEYDRDDSSDIETALFVRGGSGSPVFGVMVWQWRADDPVNSAEDIWAGLLEPYRDVWEAEERNELKRTECNPDQTLTAIGILCQVQGESDTKGLLSFWRKRLDNTEIVDAEGHIYAFVLPNDNREIGVIEYFQQVLPGVEPVDTKQMLAKFARNVVLVK